MCITIAIAIGIAPTTCIAVCVATPQRREEPLPVATSLVRKALPCPHTENAASRTPFECLRRGWLRFEEWPYAPQTRLRVVGHPQPQPQFAGNVGAPGNPDLERVRARLVQLVIRQVPHEEQAVVSVRACEMDALGQLVAQASQHGVKLRGAAKVRHLFGVDDA